MVKNKVKKRIADVFDLPPDIVLGLPKVTLIGRAQLYIENHQGITIYEKERIRINVKDGAIVIAGKDLHLRTVYNDDIFIEGVISTIDLEGNPL